MLEENVIAPKEGWMLGNIATTIGEISDTGKNPVPFGNVDLEMVWKWFESCFIGCMVAVRRVSRCASAAIGLIGVVPGYSTYLRWNKTPLSLTNVIGKKIVAMWIHSGFRRVLQGYSGGSRGGA